MSTVESPLMTVEEFLALPDDGIERDLIRGRLRVRSSDEGTCDDSPSRRKTMTIRNRFHSRAVVRVCYLLELWVEDQPEPRGEVHGGEIGCILRHDPDSTVGIDVAYFASEVVRRQTEETTIFDGAPRLAVEVLSPSDKLEEIRDKVLEYLACGVDLVWVVDPYFETVQVHRRQAAPEMFNREQTLTGYDVLPGLEIRVADIFKR